VDDVNILTFTVTANGIHGTRITVVVGSNNSLTVVIHVDPITDLTTITIDRKWPPLESVQDHQRNELLGELAWTVVITASRYHDVLSMSSMSSEHEEVCCSLAGTIW